MKGYVCVWKRDTKSIFAMNQCWVRLEIFNFLIWCACVSVLIDCISKIH